MRPSERTPEQLRTVTLETGVNRYAEGSCLVSFGHTKVLVTASIEEKVPGWMRNTGQGWVTAEYGMLPRATHTRGRREAAAGKQSGRTQEIQRLIGRSLRAVVDLKALGERQVLIDCDVIQADGGTRTASITGAWVAMASALNYLKDEGVLATDPILDQVAAVSCGVFKDLPVLDLDYEEDSTAEADSNFVLTGAGQIVEIQATGEKRGFSRAEFDRLFELAEIGCAELFALQRAAVEAAPADKAFAGAGSGPSSLRRRTPIRKPAHDPTVPSGLPDPQRPAYRLPAAPGAGAADADARPDSGARLYANPRPACPRARTWRPSRCSWTSAPAARLWAKPLPPA